MKILIIQHKNFLNGNGGTEKIACFLANHFSSIGRNVEVATNENTSGNVLFPLNKEVKISNIFTDSLNQIYIFPLYNYKGKNPFLWLKYKVQKKYRKFLNSIIYRQNGGKDNIYKYNQFDNENNFNLADFKHTLYNIKENKISIILNFPNNPTGYTPSTEELTQLVSIIDKFAKENPNKNLIIISDDAYFGLFFEENHKTPTLSATYKLVDNNNCLVVKLDGITKEYYGWGLRVGFVTYYTSDDKLREIVLEKTQGYLRSTTSSPSNLSQQIALRLLESSQAKQEKTYNDSIIEERYHILKEAIAKYNLDNDVTILPFNSGYFFTIKMPEHIDAHKFRLKFLNDYKYGVYSMDDSHIRIAFSCLDKELIPDLIKNFKLCIKEFSK